MSKAIKINVTTFAKFCAASGPAKVTVVKQAKNKYTVVGYKQGPDYWKPFRDEFTRLMRRGGSPAELRALLQSEHVRSEWVHNYKEAIEGAIKWMGRKSIVLQSCLSREWTSGLLHVTVTPEFAATINGRPYVVKLWLKSGDPLTKPRGDTILHLLDLTHGAGVGSKATVAVLDVQHSKLIVPTRLVPGVDALLKGEAASFVEMWNSL